jgi:hypothetical protein
MHRYPRVIGFWPMRRLVRISLVLAMLAVAALALLLVGGYRATQHVPEFYQKALARKPTEQKAAADQLERQVLQLHNEARKPGRWEARFSQDQINGWLASDLPVKFPGALPDGVSAPRVAIETGRMQLAVRYEQGDISTVLSLAGDAYLTDRPNEVAVHIQHVRAGAVPVPLAQFLDNIAERANDAGLPLRWTQQDGDPVALVKLPLDREEFKGQQLQVERLQIADGEIVVSGRTEGPTAGEEPKTEEPKTEEPKPEEPKPEEPKPEEPKTAEPGSTEPGADEPTPVPCPLNPDP